MLFVTHCPSHNAHTLIDVIIVDPKHLNSPPQHKDMEVKVTRINMINT
jgi:hypothetical protein